MQFRALVGELLQFLHPKEQSMHPLWTPEGKDTPTGREWCLLIAGAGAAVSIIIVGSILLT
jgi:hypothetical protein